MINVLVFVSLIFDGKVLRFAFVCARFDCKRWTQKWKRIVWLVGVVTTSSVILCAEDYYISFPLHCVVCTVCGLLSTSGWSKTGDLTFTICFPFHSVSVSPKSNFFIVSFNSVVIRLVCSHAAVHGCVVILLFLCFAWLRSMPKD